MLFFQSCVVYQQTPVSLNKAYDQGRGVINFNTGKEELKFKNIFLKDSIYTIVQKERMKNIDGSYENAETIMVLDSTTIHGIFLKDKKKSNKQTMGLAILSIPVGFAIFFLSAIIYIELSGGW